MKTSYIERAKKFIKSFYPYFCQYDISRAVRIYNAEKSRHVKFFHGAVRRCLVLSDYVIKWDYDEDNRRMFGGCEEEYNLYNRVKDSCYNYLLAEITLVEINGTRFYIMPRVNVAINRREDIDIMDFLSSDEIDFIYDEAGIHDLHEENWGFLKGKVVIFDYACFG